MITDEQIRKAWAAYYPKRRSEAESALICRLLCEVVVQRARASTIIGTKENQITDLCFSIGIPNRSSTRSETSLPSPHDRRPASTED